MVAIFFLSTNELNLDSIALAQATMTATKPSNFIVKGTGLSHKQITQTNQLCESLKAELSTLWGLPQSKQSWSPRCEIVLHATLQSYIAEVGPEGAQTKGCSYIGIDKGRVVARRIDLIVEKDGSVSALPHELTHVVVADRFGGRPVPHWFDEGIAMLADTREKQILHERDCHEAIRDNTTLELSKLLTLEQFESPQQMPAFYGQSLFLVHMLAQQKSPTQLLDFAVDATKVGYDASLRKHYSIDGVKALEQLWIAHVKADKASSKNAIVQLDHPNIAK
jgi:hypothetical protein